MQELFPGLYHLPISIRELPPGSVNVYLFRDRAGYTLVDTGWDLPSARQSLEAQLAEINAKFSDIHRVILTHGHHDHLGLVDKLKDANKALIYLHRNEIELIKIRYTKDYWEQTDLFLKRHGIPESELRKGLLLPSDTGPSAPPDMLLQGGEEIQAGDYRLQVINTPGHTPGHIALYEADKRFLISGDILLPTIATNAAGHIQHMVNPLQQHLDSLNRLKKLDVDLVLPGHEYVFSGHRKRIDELFEHHRQRSIAVGQVFADDRQPKTAYDVARLISWVPRTGVRTWAELKEIDKRFALMQTIAHLEEQTFSGKLVRFTQNDRFYYYVNPCKAGPCMVNPLHNSRG